MIFVKSFEKPAYNRREILRYAGVRESTPEINALLESCIAEADGEFCYRICYTELETDNLPRPLENAKNLEGCDSAVIFVATVGLGIDRLIAKYGITSPSRALMLQAIGAERIESLCDTFCAEFENALPRFSPGYGKILMELQDDIFALLNPSKNIGVAITSEYIMTPSKSVSAIFGLGRKK